MAAAKPIKLFDQDKTMRLLRMATGAQVKVDAVWIEADLVNILPEIQSAAMA